MRVRVLVATTILAGLISVAGARLAAIRAATDQDARATSGAISGIVVSVHTGRPLAGARIVLTGRPGPVVGVGAGATTALSAPTTQVAVSGSAGRFLFTGLPTGRFVLSAEHVDFLPASYGQLLPGKVGTPIDLSDGQQVDVRIRMSRGSAITGRVLDDANEPAVEARVRLLAFITNANGVRRLRVASQTTTDDRGVYRFAQLRPGDYYVSAAPVELVQEEAFFVGELPDDGRVGLTDLVRAIPRQPRDLFAPTYHPMATGAARGLAASVDGLTERTGVDITLLPTRLGTIRGTVTGHRPTQPVQLLLHTLDPGEEPSTATTMVDRNGEFAFESIPPGEYAVYAQTLPGASDAGDVPPTVGMPVQAVRESAFERLHGRSMVTVDGPNTPPVVIGLRPGRAISGRVVRELMRPPTGAAANVPTIISITPSPQPAGLPAFNTSPQVQAASDGTFTLPGIRPGRYFLRASGPGLVRSVMVDGIDTLDFPLEVSTNDDITGVVITLADSFSEVSGTATDSTGRPVFEGTVLAVATDSRYWTLGTRRVVTTEPGPDGRYVIRGLPPGDYRLAVVRGFEIDRRLDPNFLGALASVSSTVTVIRGGRHHQDLRLRE